MDELQETLELAPPLPYPPPNRLCFRVRNEKKKKNVDAIGRDLKTLKYGSVIFFPTQRPQNKERLDASISTRDPKAEKLEGHKVLPSRPERAVCRETRLFMLSPCKK